MPNFRHVEAYLCIPQQMHARPRKSSLRYCGTQGMVCKVVIQLPRFPAAGRRRSSSDHTPTGGIMYRHQCIIGMTILQMCIADPAIRVAKLEYEDG
jgi:hypothetical protein